ncbi:MAG: SDR family NAD(P)-dependent oxidoreductase [Promethearchaeota archaeon]
MTTDTRRTVLVTGAAGFVGSHLVDALLRQRCRVRGFDDLSTGTLANLTYALDHAAFSFVEGDIRDLKAVGEICDTCDVVVHLAAVTKVDESLREPEKYMEINVTGTQNVLQGAVQANVSRVVFASSAAVYGTPETVPTPEAASTHPLSPYGASKLQAEQLCQQAAQDHGIEVPQLRIFNVFGSRQPSDNEAGVISIFIDRAQQGLPLIIFGDGYQTRDFIYIRDVTEAILQAATLETVPSVPINIGTGIPISVRELAEVIQELIPSCSTELLFEPPRPGDIYHSVAQITRMQQLLQFTPTYSLFDGLRDYCMPESGSTE